MDGPATIWVVLVTTPKDQAEALAQALVEKRLAACVNVLPGARSFYRWEGRIESSDEALLLIKTTREGYAALEQGVRALHPYQLPEIIGLPVVAALGPYVDWVASSVGGAP